jgi:UDP-2-acetamido-3-amino-2,3-dideoxy-glucuronate N-acetyltransferase
MKIGLVGVGAWGRNHLRVWQELGALFGICETDKLNALKLQQDFPGLKVTTALNDLTGDPEITGLVITTPAETHYRLGKECILSGKDVFIEKPLALTVREGEELVELARKHSKILMVGHILRYHPAIRKLKTLIHNGELGKVNYFYSNRLSFGRIRTAENILWSFAPHDISVMLAMLNELPSTVASQGGNYLHKSMADVTVSNFQFKSGRHAHIFVSWLHPFKEQKLVVVGDRQMAVFDDVVQANKLVLYPHRINWIDNLPVPEKAQGIPVECELKEPLKEECLHFLKCLESRQRPDTDGEEGLKVLRILSACQQSLEREGEVIHFEKAEGEAQALPYFVHPTSTIDQPCKIGEGVKIWHYSHVMKDCVIGKNCNIGQNVVVSPGCVLGENVKVQNNVSIYTGVICEDDVFLGPSMVFTNVVNPRSHIVRRHEYQQTLVKRGASIGANATILCGHTIGRYAFVGAGAVVTKDVPDFALVIGNPARQAGWVCYCGNRVEFYPGSRTGKCESCGRGYEADGQRVQPLEEGLP